MTRWASDRGTSGSMVRSSEQFTTVSAIRRSVATRTGTARRLAPTMRTRDGPRRGRRSMPSKATEGEHEESDGGQQQVDGADEQRPEQGGGVGVGGDELGREQRKRGRDVDEQEPAGGGRDGPAPGAPSLLATVPGRPEQQQGRRHQRERAAVMRLQRALRLVQRRHHRAHRRQHAAVGRAQDAVAEEDAGLRRVERTRPLALPARVDVPELHAAVRSGQQVVVVQVLVADVAPDGDGQRDGGHARARGARGRGANRGRSTRGSW